jgi:hypothetical protein
MMVCTCINGTRMFHNGGVAGTTSHEMALAFKFQANLSTQTQNIQSLFYGILEKSRSYWYKKRKTTRQKKQDKPQQNPTLKWPNGHDHPSTDQDPHKDLHEIL